MTIAMTPRFKLILAVAAIAIYGYGVHSGWWQLPEFIASMFRDKTPEELFIQAVESDNLEEVKRLVESGVPVDTADNKVEVFDKDYSRRAREGDTALIIAAKCGHLGVVKYLISKKANVNYRSPVLGFTPLLGAAKYGNTDIVSLLLKNKAKPDLAGNNGHTPLMEAAGSQMKQDNAGVVKLLLKYKANPRLKNSKGKTARDLCQNPAIQTLLDEAMGGAPAPAAK